MNDAHVLSRVASITKLSPFWDSHSNTCEDRRRLTGRERKGTANAFVDNHSKRRHSPITPQECFSHGVWVTTTRPGTMRAYCTFTHARAITLSPLARIKLSCIASTMATQQDVEYNQIFLNACVLLDGLRLMTVLIVTHYF
jgi:hypothetical protein